MKEKASAMVLASFAADALALGAHWIYNTNVIDKKLGRVERFVKPFVSYHSTKELGEFTHYGDQMLVLLNSVGDAGGFDLSHFARTWQTFFKDYTGYFDQATKATLANFDAGKEPSEAGSASSDLGGASRIAPLVYRYREDYETLICSVREQTAMTHNTPHVIDSAEFFAMTAWKVLRGSTPASALKEVLDESFNKEPFRKWVSDGLESVTTDTRAAVSDFGQMCETGAAFPATIHLILKYENNLKDALVENVMAGGDSAARGMIAGMILGVHLGSDAIPGEWLSELKVYQEITRILDRIDL
jgi:ADP-ribosylglycohydrolase